MVKKKINKINKYKKIKKIKIKKNKINHFNNKIKIILNKYFWFQDNLNKNIYDKKELKLLVMKYLFKDFNKINLKNKNKFKNKMLNNNFLIIPDLTDNLNLLIFKNWNRKYSNLNKFKKINYKI